MAEFAAGAGHEINNPLAVIAGRAQLLLDGESNAQRRRELAVIHSQAMRVYEMIADMMLFARPPKPRVQPVEVAAIVSTTAGLLGQDPALRDIEIVVNGSAPPVVGDPDLLKIVFVNLLVNGAHAMNGQGIVRVSIGPRGSLSEVMFSDSGPGIPADQPIFQPLQKGAHATGLGLYLSRAFMRSFRGDLRHDAHHAGCSFRRSVQTGLRAR